MKTTSSSLKFLQPAVVTMVATLIACGLTVRPAHAGYIVTLQQVGTDVVATGNGAIDLTGLTLSPNMFLTLSEIVPKSAFIDTGPTSLSAVAGYLGFSGPTSFGSGLLALPNSGSGDIVGIHAASGLLFVPLGYISGAALSDMSTYSGKTFAILGVTPGTYEWTWGTGADQNFTLDALAPSVPDSGSTFGLFLVAVSGLFGLSRFRLLHPA
jgi:hypothetical protein